MTSQHDKAWIVPSIGAMMVWGFWAFLPKIALNTLPPHNVIFYEAIGGLFVSIPVLFFLKFKLEYEKKALGVLAGVSAFTVTAILCFFYALKNGPVAVVVTMTAMYPVICLILARVFLNERMNKMQLAAIFMAVVSIFLLAIPA